MEPSTPGVGHIPPAWMCMAIKLNALTSNPIICILLKCVFWKVTNLEPKLSELKNTPLSGFVPVADHVCHIRTTVQVLAL